MHLLYLDESGTVSDPACSHFVLAGVSVYERDTHWLEQDLNRIAAKFAPHDPQSIELHGSPMWGGRGVWRRFPAQERRQAVIDALKCATTKFPRGVRLFGVAVKNGAPALAGRDPVEYAFEELSRRFDLFLRRRYLAGDTQRGVMIFDRCATEGRIQTLARDFKYVGHARGLTRNYAEVPLFLDSKASRLIQLADLVAFSMFRHYERGNSEAFNLLRRCFDTEGGIVHGLHEVLS